MHKLTPLVLALGTVFFFGAGCAVSSNLQPSNQPPSTTTTPATTTVPGSTTGTVGGTSSTPAIILESVTATDQTTVATVIKQDRDIQQVVGQSLLSKPFAYQYADVTGIKKTQAVVSISSGGSAGTLYVIVVGKTSTGLTILARLRGTQMQVTTPNHTLVIKQPQYKSDDPNGRPSAMVTSTYVWNGTTFVKQGDVVTPNT